MSVGLSNWVCWITESKDLSLLFFRNMPFYYTSLSEIEHLIFLWFNSMQHDKGHKLNL